MGRGAMIVPRCLPALEYIRKPSGADRYKLLFRSILVASRIYRPDLPAAETIREDGYIAVISMRH